MPAGGPCCGTASTTSGGLPGELPTVSTRRPLAFPARASSRADWPSRSPQGPHISHFSRGISGRVVRPCHKPASRAFRVRTADTSHCASGCLRRYREGLPLLGPAWDLDPAECLFTQEGRRSTRRGPAGTRRSRTGLLNVGRPPEQGKYYARVYHDGRTHCSQYFERAEEAAGLRGRSGASSRGRQAASHSPEPTRPAPVMV